MDLEADFTYALSPFVTFPNGGTVTADVRNNSRRGAKDIISLTQDGGMLSFRVDRAVDGGKPRLVFVRDGKVVASAGPEQNLIEDWTKVKISWAGREASMSLGDGAPIKLDLPVEVKPVSLDIKTAHVDDLQVTGNGSLNLSWDDGYAASVQAGASSMDVTVRFHGFDVYFVSLDPAKRDCPMIEVLNASADRRAITFDFDIAGELTGRKEVWKQVVIVEPHSAAMVAMQLPSGLESDVYHLNIRSPDVAVDEAKHFVYVEPRDELKGPPKFGIHESGRNSDFGFWPDSLPIDLCHLYTYWGYVVGPAWVEDPAVTEKLAPAEWNWNPRIETAAARGLTTYVSLQSRPFAPWMRERDYPPQKMKTYPWGVIGGFPNIELYRKFISEVAKKYKGKVGRYEIENEPMSYLGGIPPEDYVQIAKAVTEEVHAVDPSATIYGICGTGDFVPWMRKVFELGGANAMDGVAIHTYVAPSMPEDANLAGKISEVEGIMKASGKKMPLLNSETGTYVALREEVDRPIPPARLKELIDASTPNLYVRSGWPFYAQDERKGSISIVRNAVFNFLGGSEYFTFFGFNPDWPNPDWFSGGGPNGAVTDSCWAIISATKDGVRTPSHYTLAIGVLTEQLKGAKQSEGKPVNEDGIRGGVFPKQDGGEVAVLWSPLGRRSTLVESSSPTLELISLYGKKQVLSSSPVGGRSLFRVELSDDPVYLHSPEAGLALVPSPVVAVAQEVKANGKVGFRFTLANKYEKPWSGALAITGPSGWKIDLAKADFALDAGKRQEVKGVVDIPQDTPRGVYTLDASVTLPSGEALTFPVSISVRPTFAVSEAPAEFAWQDDSAWAKVQPAMMLDRPDQLALGRPPQMASLQEERFWKGGEELSGEVKVASNSEKLFVFLSAKDANFRVPATWPGVLGSSVELFLDVRPSSNELGKAPYAKGVSQIVFKPGDSIEFWNFTEKFSKIEGVEVSGAMKGLGKYWLAVAIPWKSLGIKTPNGLNFGFDIGLNGPHADGTAGRKNQMMLFGDGANSKDPSGFGLARVPLAP